MSHKTQMLLIIPSLTCTLFCWFQCGDSFLQLFVDMCIFAINVDKGQMEANRNEGNREAAAARRSDMASICDKLSCLCHQISIKVARICALTAFALRPTEEAFRKIGALYDQGSSQSPNGKNQSPGVVNPATLYEVERLLNMLRPGYLNPDQLFTNIQILCRRYLQECLIKVEEFQKVRCSSQSLSDTSSIAGAKIETSEESASSTTSYMSTVLAESLSSEDVQDIQLLLSRMRILNITHPKTPLEDLGTSTPKLPSLPRSVRFDHSYQTTKTIPNILEMNTPYKLGAKKVSIKQEHQHNLVKEGDKTQQKGNRSDEPQTIGAGQPLNPELTHQPLQQSKQLNEIILAAINQDSAALFKLAQSASAETIQTAISIIKSKLQNSSVPINDQQQRSTSVQINNPVYFTGAQPTGSTHLEPSSNLQQRQSQLHLQIIQDGVRGHSSHAQSARPHLYNQQVVTSACNSLPHFQAQSIRAQAPNIRNYLSPSSLTMDNGKQVTANSVALHSINTATSSSSTTSGSLSQEKLKAESLLLAKSCVGEIRHFLQSQFLDSQQRQIREAPEIARSAVTLPGVSIVSTSAGAEYSSSNRLQSAAALAKQATVSKIQENFSQNILYQIQQHITKQDQTGVSVNNRPYTLSILQPQPLYQPQQQHGNSKNNQQTISSLLAPSSIGVSKSNVSNGKSSLLPVSHGVLQTLKPHIHDSVMPSVTHATQKPQSSSLVVIKQPKIISFSSLPNMPTQQPVIEVNKCSALYVTTCPVSCIHNISQSNLNNCNSNLFTQHNSAKHNTVSQSNLNNKQIQPLFQNILPNLGTITGLSLSNQQPSLVVPNILSNMTSQSSLNNRSSKPLYQNILPNVNTTAVSTLNNQQSHPVIQHILPNTSPQSSLNNRQSTSVAQNSLPKLHTITVQSLNNLQTSDSVQHAFIKPNISTLPTLDNKQPKHLVQNSCSKYGEEIPKSQQFEVILANAASIRPKENITVQRYEAAKSNDTVYDSQSLMQSKTISDNNCANVSNNALYRCIICGIAFKTLDDLRHHVKFECKPEQQSSSAFSTKFKQNKASASYAGGEASTVFQCLRCFELCISQAGIKQHRLICKKVPLKPSHLKKVTDNKEKDNSSSIAGDDNCNNRQSQGDSKENSDTEFSSKTRNSCGGNSVSTISIDTSCQLTVSGQLEDSINKQGVANAHGIKQPRSVGSELLGYCEPKSISNQEIANYIEANTLQISESDNTFGKEKVVTSAVNQHERKQPGSSDPINMFSIQPVTNVLVHNLVNTESRSISNQQLVSDVQTSTSSQTESATISNQQLVSDVQPSRSLNPESRTNSSQQLVSDVQTSSAKSSNGLHNIPELTSQPQSTVPLKSECAILPGQVPGTSNISKTLAAFTSGLETDKSNLVTFQPNITRPATINNSENLPPISTAVPDYLNMSQNSVAAVIANAAYQMPLNVAFMNSSSVTAKENTLFPLSKLCFSIDDATTNKKIGNDNLIDASPRKRTLLNTKVVPGAACPDLEESGAGKYVICGACLKVVSTTSSFRAHLETCTMRNTTETRIRALQEKVQNAKYLSDDVCSGLMRVVENVTGVDGDAPKVVHVDCVKSSVVPMMQVCTDEVVRNSSKNADSVMQVSILQNADCDGSSQGDIREFKSNVMAIASEVENKNTIDALDFMGERNKIKEVVVNESIDGGLVTKNFPEIIDTEGRSCKIKNEAHMLTNCVDGAVKSIKTKENVNDDVRYSKESKTNSLTVVNSGKDSLFCKICQVLYRSERILLRHFVVKHLKPYTVKISNSSLSYICHFCQNSFAVFQHYMQHMPHHSVIVYKKMKSFQVAKTSQNSQRNAMQKKVTQKQISKNVTVTMKNRKTASISATSRRERQLLAVRTKSFLDKCPVSRSLCHSCVPADKDCNHNEAEHTVTECKSETKCMINNNSVNHDESCCQMEMNAHHSPEHAMDTCQEVGESDLIVGDTCDRSSRNMRGLPVTRRRKAALKNHSQFSKQRRISEVTETSEKDLERGTLEKRAPSDQSECYTHPDCPVNRNPVSADHQLTQGENSDLLKGFNEASELRKNSSIRFSQRLRKKLQPDVAHSKSVKTLLCSKDLEATPSCNNSTITAHKLQLTIVKDTKNSASKSHTKYSASKSHFDVTIKPPSCIAPKPLKPSFLDSYLSYISNYPVPEATTITTKEK